VTVSSWCPLWLLCAVTTAALGAAPARAHSLSSAHSTATVAADRTSLRYQLLLSVADLSEALGIDDDPPSRAQVEDGAERLFAYVTARIDIEGDGARCTPERLDVPVLSAGRDEFVTVAWQCRWPAPIDLLAVDYQLFFDLDPRHTGLLTASYAGQSIASPLIADASRFEWRLTAAPTLDATGFLLSGVDHILYGIDHLLFLLGLLLVAGAAPRDGSQDCNDSQARSRRRVLSYALAIVTAFTIAHSITLAIAALGWVELPDRLVESTIAASIVFVAVENLALPAPRRRWQLSFAFGLIHGLGFASMLRPLLPNGQVVGPLLFFNAGVELGQLGVVAIALPALYLLGTRLGAGLYRRAVVIPGSVAVGLAGLVWFVQRALAINWP
jgi:hydrogenase/urease accessory protein HupE